MRATLPGRLVLGQGFRAFDLVCYVIGVGLGASLELSAWSSGATAERTLLPRGELVDGLAAHDLLDILDGTDVHGDGP